MVYSAVLAAQTDGRGFELQIFTNACEHISMYVDPGFETQGRHHQKSKTGLSAAPRKELMSSKIF